MESVRQYLLAVTAAALICGIVKCVVDEKSVSGTVIRLVAGLIMTLTVLSPVVRLNLGVLPEIASAFAADGKLAASYGEELAAQQVNTIIKDQLQAYILDKAAAFGAKLEVEIIMPDDNSSQPEGVILRGDVSPHAKARLQEMIEEDLSIAKEKQQWIG